MKKITETGVVIMCAALLFCGCNQASKKDLNNVREDLNEANKDLEQAVTDANDTAKARAKSDWQSFKNESDTAITRVEKQLNELDSKIASSNKKERERLKYEINKTKQKLMEIEEKLNQRNADFSNDIHRFDTSFSAKNQSFKREFRHDMNELGTALKDLFKNNVK